MDESKGRFVRGLLLGVLFLLGAGGFGSNLAGQDVSLPALACVAALTGMLVAVAATGVRLLRLGIVVRGPESKQEIQSYDRTVAVVFGAFVILAACGFLLDSLGLDALDWLAYSVCVGLASLSLSSAFLGDRG